MDAENNVELTQTENELYDRQIRLWGLESQKRLRSAKVLISGLNGFGAEVTKNIILSGVHSVKLHDDKVITEQEICAQFLVPRSALGLNRAEASIERARALNPMVEISYDVEPLSEKNAEFFAQFDVVVVSDAPNSELLRVDNICNEHGVNFFVGEVWGMYGFCFTDLQHHTYVEDVAKHKISSSNGKFKSELVYTTVQGSMDFPPYSSVLDFDISSQSYQKKLKRTGPVFPLIRVLQKFRETFGRDPSYKSREEDIKKLEQIRNEDIGEEIIPSNYFEHVFCQVSPTAAVVGGELAQEVIKCISKKEAPHCNVFLFDPNTCCGFVETIGVK